MDIKALHNSRITKLWSSVVTLKWKYGVKMSTDKVMPSVWKEMYSLEYVLSLRVMLVTIAHTCSSKQACASAHTYTNAHTHSLKRRHNSVPFYDLLCPPLLLFFPQPALGYRLFTNESSHCWGSCSVISHLRSLRLLPGTFLSWLLNFLVIHLHFIKSSFTWKKKWRVSGTVTQYRCSCDLMA